MPKLHIREAIIVEGKYDKNTLSQLVDAQIIETKGFGIFKNESMQRYIRDTAQRCGILILTDSDASGFVIRNAIKSFVPAEYIRHAYIPDIFGKEKRKSSPGKEGKLGVEGMTPEILLKALADAGVTVEDTAQNPDPITLTDLYKAGFTGTECSKAKRLRFLAENGLPEHLSTKAMLDAMNLRMTRQAFLTQYLKEGEMEK